VERSSRSSARTAARSSRSPLLQEVFRGAVAQPSPRTMHRGPVLAISVQTPEVRALTVLQVGEVADRKNTLPPPHRPLLVLVATATSSQVLGQNIRERRRARRQRFRLAQLMDPRPRGQVLVAVAAAVAVAVAIAPQLAAPTGKLLRPSHERMGRG